MIVIIAYIWSERIIVITTRREMPCSNPLHQTNGGPRAGQRPWTGPIFYRDATLNQIVLCMCTYHLHIYSNLQFAFDVSTLQTVALHYIRLIQCERITLRNVIHMLYSVLIPYVYVGLLPTIYFQLYMASIYAYLYGIYSPGNNHKSIKVP
jgi:hypothetical protein